MVQAILLNIPSKLNAMENFSKRPILKMELAFKMGIFSKLDNP